MKMYLLITHLLLHLALFYSVNAQTIILDESISDWSDNDIVANEKGDNTTLDFETLSVSNDETYLFLRLKINNELLLQSNSNILFALDIDNNAQTGFAVEGIGSELIFNFGNRTGKIYRGNNDFEIFHDDIGLITSPTVSSDEFEIAIERRFNVGGTEYFIGNDISFYFLDNRGSTSDYIPNRGNAARYTLNENLISNNSNFQIEKDPLSDFRILSYNVRRDDIFDPSKAEAYQNILQTLIPDVFCFQEIYDNSAQDVYDRLISWNVLDPNDEWFLAKNGNDIITISKFPIKFDREIGGNGMIVLDVNNRDVIVFNLHLPCCDNDQGRVNEIDQMLALIRESKNGNSSYPFAENSPIVILGDMNFVGFSSQVNSIINGDVINTSQYGNDFSIDWDNSGLADLIPQTTGFSSSFTWKNTSSSFFPGRLDYIFYTDSQLESLNSLVFNTRGINEQALLSNNLNLRDTETASDHSPLISDFKFKVEVSNSKPIVNQYLKFYPNPATDRIFVESNNKAKEINVYAVDGTLIIKHMEDLSSSTFLEVEVLQSGYYILEVLLIDGTYLRKPFVKK